MHGHGQSKDPKKHRRWLDAKLSAWSGGLGAADAADAAVAEVDSRVAKVDEIWSQCYKLGELVDRG